MEGPEAAHRHVHFEYQHHFNSSTKPWPDNRLVMASAYEALTVRFNAAIPLQELPSGAENAIYAADFVMGPEAAFNPGKELWL